MIEAGILGASGYMGGEVLRVLLSHPEVHIRWATSRQQGDIAEFHPNLYGCDINLIHPDNITPVDVAFMALPTAASIPMTLQLQNMGCKVIDLGAAFRLSNQDHWQRLYQQTHPHWSLVEQAVYGIPELHLDDIQHTSLVANPGCFASAAILALAPLVQQQCIDLTHIHVNGISGTAGVGAELSRAAHHPEIGNNLIPYNVVDHRHSYEMEQELSALSTGQPVTVHFTPVYAPITRGILNICHVMPTKNLSRQQLLEIFRQFYHGHPFIKVYDMPASTQDSWQYRPYPWVSAVAGSNYCYLGMDIDERRQRMVIFSVLDSIGKGGAQVGIENMNLMFGLERTRGLTALGRHPG